MDKINVYIYDQNSSKNVSIELPASFEHIEDAYERLGKRENLSAEFSIQFEDGHFIDDIDITNINIYELNHLATRIQSFNILEIFKLQGSVKKIEDTDYDIKHLINIVENILQNENIEAFPASTPKELGEFYVENNLIPEIENTDGDVMAWILEYSDYESIGKNLKERLGGVFSRDAFVVVGELDELYSGEFKIPEKCDYIFKLKVGFNPEKDDGSNTVILLPASNNDIKNLLNEYDRDYSKLSCYEFESIVPLLERMDFVMSDIETLNQLAHSIRFFRENNKLVTYKAMVDALPIIDLEKVNELCDYVYEFTLQMSTTNLEEYVVKNSNITIPEELIEYINIREYGKKLLERDGANLTEYGALIPKDGISLVQKLEQIAPTQTMQIDCIK